MANREPWYRFYVETTADKKIKRIATVMQMDKYMVIGAWAVILAMAKASPIEGSLFIATNVPATLHDIAEELGIESSDTLDAMMRWFIDMEMVEVLRYEDREFYHLLHWHERQFRSDISADRVRAYRQRNKDKEGNVTETLHETKEDINEKSPGVTTPENVTLQGRYMKRNSNTPDTDTDTDTDKELNSSSSSGKASKIFRLYEKEIGLLTPMIADRLKDAEQTYPEDWIPVAMSIAVSNNKRSWRYVEGILKRWKVDGFQVDNRPANNGRGPGSRQPKPIRNAALRKVLGMADDE